jgi:hypothetical protein
MEKLGRDVWLWCVTQFLDANFNVTEENRVKPPTDSYLDQHI